MTFHVAGRQILQNNSRITVAGDYGVDSIRFILPRWYGKLDLALGEPVALFSNASGQAGGAQLSAMPSEDRLVLSWTVGREAAAQAGQLEVWVCITAPDRTWQYSTEATVFQIGQGLTGDGSMILSPEMYLELLALLDLRGLLVTDITFDEANHGLALTRYDGSETVVPLPPAELVAEII